MHRRSIRSLSVAVAALGLIAAAAPAQALFPPDTLRVSAWTWSETQPDAPWAGRAGLQVVERGGSFFLMGGRTPIQSPVPGASTIWGDVWRSDDRGVTWRRVLETNDAQHWPARAYFQAVTLRGGIYVLGGQNFRIEPNPGCAFLPPGVPCDLPDVPASDFFNDVWRSYDGEHWQEMTPHAPWAGRAGLSAAVLDGAIYVFGGSVNDDSAVVGGGAPPRIYFNDVWRSYDGRTWTRMTEHASWAARAGAATVVKDGWIYLLGGEDGFVCNEQTPRCPPYYNDVWRTRNGRNWEQVTAEAGWSARPGHQCVVTVGRILCFGGFGLFGNPVDMWASATGARWRQLPQTPWDATSGDEVKYDFDALATWEWRRGRLTPAVYSFGGDRETFDFLDPTNYLRVDDDVWRFAPGDV